MFDTPFPALEIGLEIFFVKNPKLKSFGIGTLFFLKGAQFETL